MSSAGVSLAVASRGAIAKDFSKRSSPLSTGHGRLARRGAAIRRSSDIMFPDSVAAVRSRAVTSLDKVTPLPWQSATLQLGC
jgi:hypothetical protein